MRAGRADQHPPFAQFVDDVQRGLSVRLARLGVGELHADVQARASDVPDSRAPGRRLGNGVAKGGADGTRVLGELLIFDHIQDSRGCGQTDRVAAERVEVADLLAEFRQ